MYGGCGTAPRGGVGPQWVSGGEALVDSHYRRGQHSGAGLPKIRGAAVNVRASRGWV